MKQRKTNLEREYHAALAYYQRTVWGYVEHVRLAGAQYAVARRAWERLDKAQRAWFDSLNLAERKQAGAREPNLRTDFHPHRLERDDTIRPELLAAVAATRLGTAKPKSIRTAVGEAQQILLESRDCLEKLPAPVSKVRIALDAYFSSVSFKEILESSGERDRVPLLPTVQASRNKGTLSSRALEQALKRYAVHMPKKVKAEIGLALKNKEISCRLLEEIRWDRFKLHFKG